MRLESGERRGGGGGVIDWNIPECPGIKVIPLKKKEYVKLSKTWSSS